MPIRPQANITITKVLIAPATTSTTTTNHPAHVRIEWGEFNGLVFYMRKVVSSFVVFLFIVKRFGHERMSDCLGVRLAYLEITNRYPVTRVSPSYENRITGCGSLHILACNNERNRWCHITQAHMPDSPRYRITAYSRLVPLTIHLLRSFIGRCRCNRLLFFFFLLSLVIPGRLRGMPIYVRAVLVRSCPSWMCSSRP